MQYKYLGPVVFMILLAGALLVLFKPRDGTLARRTRDFVPDDLSGVDRVRITRQGQSLELDLSQNGTWTVDGEVSARKDRINLLFAFMDRLEIVSPAAKKIRDEMTVLLSGQGTRVQLYVGGKPDKDFRIYYDSTDIKGTYMMLARTEAPYLVRLKGYAGDNLENIFEANRKSWQENIFLDLGPADIREVEVEYPMDEGKSFRLIHSGEGSFQLSGKEGQVTDAQTDRQEMEDYLYFFSNIRFEYLQEGIPAAGLASASPFVLLRVVSNKGHNYDLKGYRLHANRDLSGGIDMSRFMGVIHQGHDTVMLDYDDLDPILRRLEDFQKK